MFVKLAIAGAKLIDGFSTRPTPDSVVLVGSDGRVAEAGPRERVAIPEGATVVDARGMTLLPGLVDAHVHLAWDKDLYAVHAVGEHTGSLNNAFGRLVRAGHFAQMALAAGVTTVRDCGADDLSLLALRDRVEAGQFTGPRILACGRFITTTAGHAYTDWGVDSVDQVRKAVRTLASKGVDLIKLLLSGGTTSPGTNITRAQYSREELRAAVQDAHRLGLPVAVHAISTDSIIMAAEAGVDTIEHCSWIGPDRRTVTDEGAVQQMVEHGVIVDHAIIPRPYLFPDEYAAPPTPEEQWWLDMLQVRWRFLHFMRERGVTVCLGTDAAFGPWPGTGCWPGCQELARAIEIMVRWGGFTPLEAISMATSEAAKALHREGELGAIRKGRRADLILVAGDPLSDIRALRQVDRVWRDGRLVAEGGRIVLAGAEAGTFAPRGWELPR